MAKQLAFYFEQKHCVGCKTCQIACKDKNNLAVGQLFRRVSEQEGGTYEKRGAAVIPRNVYAFWLSISCNHCVNPVCVEHCPTAALQKRAADGIVHIDQERCIGCKTCIKYCPYGAPQFNPATNKVGKCDFCRDLLAEGKEPVCVSSCPVRTLGYGTLDELREKYGALNQTKGLPNATITQPALVITPHRHAISS